jgi:hypothetical protein
MHFYELHEGDAELFFDLVLVREEEMDADEFFTIVQSIRRQVQDSYETDSLIEAIAEELERNYGFVFVSDDRLTAAVNVSKREDENFLADLDGDEYEEDAEGQAETEGDAEFRSVYADFDPADPGLN